MPTRREGAVSVGVAVVLTVGWLLILPTVRTICCDPAEYLGMAADPTALGHTPYAFRGLVPWLAHSLGGASHYRGAFEVVTATGLAAAGPAVYLLCRRLGGTHAAALVGMAALMSLPQWLFNLYQPYLIDGPAMAATAWVVTALAYGYLAALPALLVVATLAREYAVGLALPIYLWLRQRWVDLPAAGRVALLVAPAVLAGWAIQQPMRTRGYDNAAALLVAGARITFHKNIATRPLSWLFFAFAGSLGIWWLLGWYGRRHGGRLWWLLVPVLAQLAVGGDWSRFALYAFPVVVPAGAVALWRHPRRRLLLALVAAQSLAVVADLVVSGHPAIVPMQPSTYVTMPLLALTAAVLWWPRRAPAADQGLAGGTADPSPAYRDNGVLRQVGEDRPHGPVELVR